MLVDKFNYMLRSYCSYKFISQYSSPFLTSTDLLLVIYIAIAICVCNIKPSNLQLILLMNLWRLIFNLCLAMTVFLFTDIHTISVIKTSESYVNITTGFQYSFTEINELIQGSQITVAGKTYQLNFFLCCDYKVTSYIHS